MATLQVLFTILMMFVIFFAGAMSFFLSVVIVTTLYETVMFIREYISKRIK